MFCAHCMNSQNVILVHVFKATTENVCIFKLKFEMSKINFFVLNTCNAIFRLCIQL